MTREFLSAQSAAPAAAAIAAAARAAPVPATMPPQLPAHPLAGAFPAWDLLPAAPFVRRVR